MTTRSEKEKQKAQQEKFQAILSNLLKDDDNKYCVDCDAKGPRWASWNLGIFLCIRCAGIHRNLGVHISKVKSVNLDTWTPEQIATVMEMGNSRARAVYEANLQDNYRRPQTDSALESFIRAKYETKKYIAKEWVPPKVTVPKELLEDDRDKKKSKTKTASSVQLASVPKSQTSSSTTSQKVSLSKPAESRPVAQTTINTPQPAKAPPPKSNTADLIGLDAPSSGPVQTANSNSLLGDLADFMGSGVPQSTSSQPNTSSTTNPVTNGSTENNLFGETATSSTEPKASTKDSIMALYGGQQTTQQQQQFGVPDSNYRPQYEGMGGVVPTNHPTPNDTPVSLYRNTGYTYGNGQEFYVNVYNGGMYMPQQAQPVSQPNMGPMYGMNNMNNMQPMQQPPMYGNQMGMMGMQQGPMGNMGMPQQQQGMMRPQGNMAPNMGMFSGQQQQPQMQQMQYNQMQQQMANMRLGQPGSMAGPGGMMQNGIPAGQGWGGQPSGQTMSANLWQ